MFEKTKAIELAGWLNDKIAANGRKDMPIIIDTGCGQCAIDDYEALDGNLVLHTTSQDDGWPEG